MIDYENCVRYSCLCKEVIGNTLRQARDDMKERFGESFLGLRLPPCAQPVDVLDVRPAVLADAPSPGGVFVCRAGQYKVYSVRTETGSVYEYVKE